MPMPQTEQYCVNAIRFLAADAIQKANSGHPGIVLGSAPMGFVLWDHFLKHNPKNPNWFNRDRFVLSAGHGSMLLYSMLHLTGYDSVTLDDIKEFRQWGSHTPGHPENRFTVGVEVTTGPLGQGLANGVGLAIAEAHLAARFNKPDCNVVDHHVYVITGDGCQMEGISAEAVSLAGHLGLGKLIALYDDNQISIDGSTALTFTEDVDARYEACGWHVETVADGDSDLEAIAKAIENAKAVTDKPSLVRIRTTIGYGSPNQGTEDTHGAPLGTDKVEATRKALGWDHEPFVVPQEVYDHTRKAIERGAAAEEQWNETFAEYTRRYPEDAAAFNALLSKQLPDGWEDRLPSFSPDEIPGSTRRHSGECLNAIAKDIPLIGGSADLTLSNKAFIKESGDFGPGNYANRNLRFGVREHAMGAICNGIALHRSGLVPYAATFLVFSDYMRSAIRTSALSYAGVIFVMTHDSVAVGEDGPTHQPIEHLVSLRAIPKLVVIRPADGNEVTGAYRVAIPDRKRPFLFALSRQKVPHLPGTKVEEVQRGAYVIADSADEPEIILIGTGGELQLCIGAAEILRKDGIRIRVVSMPSWELFEDQDDTYREAVLPSAITRRVTVEAGSTMGWQRYATHGGISIGIDCFGRSAPGPVALAKFGFTVENVVEKARTLLG